VRRARPAHGIEHRLGPALWSGSGAGSPGFALGIDAQ